MGITDITKTHQCLQVRVTVLLDPHKNLGDKWNSMAKHAFTQEERGSPNIKGHTQDQSDDETKHYPQIQTIDSK